MKGCLKCIASPDLGGLGGIQARVLLPEELWRGWAAHRTFEDGEHKPLFFKVLFIESFVAITMGDPERQARERESSWTQFRGCDTEAQASSGRLKVMVSMEISETASS